MHASCHLHNTKRNFMAGKFFKSISMKITLSAGVSLLLLSTAIILFSSLSIKNESQKVLKEKIISEAEKYSGIIKAELEIALDAARTLSQVLTTQKSANASFSREQVNLMLKQVLKENNSFLGVYTLWEPNTFDGRDRDYKGKTGHDSSGRFAPYWCRNSKGKISLAPLLDYTKPMRGDYYLIPREKKNEQIINPYPYPVQDETILITSLVSPVMHKDKFYGIAGVDISLDFLQKISDQEILNGDGKLIILSHNGTICAMTGSSSNLGIKINLRDQQNFTKDILNKIQNSKIHCFNAGNNFGVSVSISPGKTDTPWYSVITVPESSLSFYSKQTIQDNILIGLAITLICLGILYYISSNISKPIRSITKAAGKIADGDYSPEINIKTNNEIEEMAFALKNMLQNLKETEDSLRKSEQRWKFALEGNLYGVWDWDLKKHEVYYSLMWKKMLGYEESEINNSFSEWEKRVHPDDIEKAMSSLKEHLNSDEKTYFNEYRMKKKDGSFIYVLSKGRVTQRDNDGRPLRFIGTHEDITERNEARKNHILDEKRLKTFLELYQMTDRSNKEVQKYALEKCVELTESESGYFAFLNNDETVLDMKMWSDYAEKNCMIPNRKTLYSLSETGLWGEAVRKRTGIITNDYNSPDTPRKGVPAGHIPIERHMNIPVFEGNRIVLVAGVCNKKSDYNEADHRQLSLLMQGLWRMLKQKETTDELKKMNFELTAVRRELSYSNIQLEEKEKHLSRLLNGLPGIIFKCKNDDDWTILYLSDGFERITGYNTEDFIYKKNKKIFDIIHIDDREKIFLNIKESISKKKRFTDKFRIITKDNNEIIVMGDGYALQNDNGTETLEGVVYLLGD